MAEEYQPQLHRNHEQEEYGENKTIFDETPKTLAHHDETKGPDNKELEKIKTVDEAKEEAVVEAKDRGLFSFIGKKEEEDEKKLASDEVNAVSMDFEKVNAEEKPEEKEKKSNSSSSSSDDEEGEKKGKKKGIKEKIKEMVSGGGEDKKEEEKLEKEVDVAPTEAIEEAADQAKEKGLLGKIKDKFPIPETETKNTEDAPHPTPPPTAEEAHGLEDEPKEKKGIFEKIKDKIPGYQTKTPEDKEEKEGATH